MKPSRRELFLGWSLLVLVSVLYFFANLQKVVVPGSVFNELQQQFGCAAAGITGLGAGFMYAYSFNQLTVGVLADRYGGARVIAYGGALFCLGSLLSAYTGSLWVLMFSRILTGFGASAVYLSMLKLIFRFSPGSFTLVLGIIMLIGYSGSIVSGAPFVKLSAVFGYTSCMLTIGIVTAIVYLLFVMNTIFLKKPPVDHSVKLNFSPFKTVLMRRHNLCVYLTTGIAFALFYSMQMTIGKKYMEDFTGMRPDSAGILMSIAMVISSCNAFILALLSKLCGNRRRIFIRFCGFGSLTAALMLLCAVLFELRCWQLSAAAWLLMSFAGNTTTINVALQKETNPDNQVGTALCVGNFFSYLVIAVIGSFVGWLLELVPPQQVNGIKLYSADSYLLVFIMMSVLALISAVFSLRIVETRGRQMIQK